jgi:hypothetical protein
MFIVNYNILDKKCFICIVYIQKYVIIQNIMFIKKEFYMTKHMKSISKQKMLIAIGALTLSHSVLAQTQENANQFANYEVEEQDLQLNEEPESISDDQASVYEGNQANPFMNLSSTLEQLQLKQQEKDSELNLVESEIELQRRQFEKEMLPYQMEIERAQIQEELYAIQNRMQEPIPPPSITMNDIENRIDAVAGEILRQQKEEIAQLEKEKGERIERENTFNLKLISENSKDGVFSIITSGEGEDYRVTEGDYANDWQVIGIDKERMSVVVRKDGKTEVVSPDRASSLSIISMSKSSSQESSDESGSDIDNIPDPNF